MIIMIFHESGEFDDNEKEKEKSKMSKNPKMPVSDYQNSIKKLRLRK